jgi:hypothetical protein|tara:strand:+ start:3198 stop:3662 length:465 start_codon:yes stop_codon:yes gene_type:complete
MVNAWSLAASILDGTFEEDYPVMDKDDEWIEKSGGYEWTPGSPWPPEVLNSVEDLRMGNPPVYPKQPVDYKYNEDQILDSIKEYIGKTYSKHYSNKIQTLDLIDSVGDASAFCRSNILKYASRYDKKGTAKLDIQKIMHYAVLLYHFEELDKDS